MIVNDDDDLRHVLLTQLEREGVAVEQAETMEAAFDKIDNFAPDILILDVQLPDGVHIYRQFAQTGFEKPLCSPARMVSRKSQGWIRGK